MDPLIEAYLGIYDNIDEANRWEKESGIGGKTPEAELARMRSRAFHTGGVKSKKAVNPSDIDSGSLEVNRGVARMVHARNRGKSPSDPTYSHRRKIDPLKIPSYRESPLGRPRGYKEPLKSRANNKNPGTVSDKVNANIKHIETEVPVNAKSNIRKFHREELEYILDVLVSEGFAVDYDGAVCILEAMSDEWLDCILDEKYVKQMDTTGRGPDHRTRFRQFYGRDNEFTPKFVRRRARVNDKRIDPYFTGKRERKTERRQGVGGFRA